MPKGRWPKESPHIRGQGQWQRVSGCYGAETAERSYPASQVRGGGREEQSQARGQGRRPGGPTPHPRSRGCLGAGGLEELSHVEGQEGAALRRYPSSKVRSRGCALLEQP